MILAAYRLAASAYASCRQILSGRGRDGRSGCRAGATGLFVLLLFTTASAADAAEDDGLRLEVATTYRVDPAAGVVDVVLDVSATNTLDDLPDEFGVTRFYFDEVVFLIPAEARSIAATEAEGSLDFMVLDRSDEGIAEVGIALAPRLYSGSTAQFTVTFTLPGGEPRTNGDLRVNDAFVSFYVWAYGDPGLSTVAVELPRRFEVEVLGDPLEPRGRAWRSESIEDPAAWVAVLSARDDTALVTSEIAVGDAAVEIAAWPDDPEWADEVERVLGDGIPVLEDLTGFALDTDLRITESLASHVQEYAGEFDGESGEVEIGEDLDAQLILHEVAHVWFDDTLFDERWIAEGLADTYAALTLERLGRDGEERRQVDRADPLAVPLNSWADPSFDGRSLDRTEDYAYAAARHVIDAVAGEIGSDALADVLAAAEADLIAYRGGTSPEPVAQPRDWRRFLDLLEEVGGSTTAEELFGVWVVTDDQRAAMDRRSVVRAEYHAVEDAAGGWSLPLALRSAMGEWDFGTASVLLDGASEVLEWRDRLRRVTEVAGAVPPSLEGRFEAGDDADLLVAELAAQIVVVETVADASAAVEQRRTIIEQVGLLGSDPAADVRAAIAAVESGRLGEGAEAAEAAQRAVIGAERNGFIRLGVGLALLVVASISMLLLRRRRQKPPAPVESLVGR